MSKAAIENVIVVLPSLNPTEKLLQEMDGLAELGLRELVVVDDGSGEAYAGVFADAASREGCTLLTHPVNRGKGAALKTAFAWILEHRPDVRCVVTADADGQHLPKDVLRCAEACLEKGEDFDGSVLGCRDFSGPDVPFKSRNGNRITCGVFRLCGVRCSDTQTGLRAFPGKTLPLCCEVRGERYEYETNVLLELHRRGLRSEEIKITTVYEDNNKGSHFHPVRDSWRIYKLIFRYIGRRLWQFVKFALSSGFSTAVDYAVFYLVMLLIGGPEGRGRVLLCTCAGRLVSSVVNYTLNHKKVFHCKTDARKTILRYYAICIPQMLIAAGLLALLKLLFHADEAWLVTLLKVPVDVTLFLASFRLQKRWVFK